MSASCTPEVDISTKLKVYSNVAKELEFMWEELMQMPMIKKIVDMYGNGIFCKAWGS